MRVIVVDDSAFMRRALSRMIEEDPGVPHADVVGMARNGVEGLEMIRKLRPDVVTMDIEMPEMDGLTALRQLRRFSDVPVIVLSSLTTHGSRAAIRALHLGAQEVLAKDASQVSLGIGAIRDELLSKLRGLHEAHRHTAGRSTFAAPPPPRDAPPPSLAHVKLVCIGSSTGGPPVLERILTALPAELSAPIVIAQHMPRAFTESLSQRLDSKSLITVEHAVDERRLEPGHAYVIPGGQQGQVKAGLHGYRLVVGDEPAGQLYKPSVDVLLHSAAATGTAGREVLGVILTGMGNDGSRGAKALHERGGVILAQSAETCVVYGMPKAVTESGVAHAMAPAAIARQIGTLVGNRSRLVG